MNCIIIIQNTTIGLLRDASILQVFLEKNHIQTDIHYYKKSLPQNTYTFLIFIEHIIPSYFKDIQYTYSIFVPNIEQIVEWDMENMKNIQYVFCKTKQTYDYFKNISNAIYTKFASVDDLQPKIEKDTYTVGHFSGTSPYKNTKAVLECWIENNCFLDIHKDIQLVVVKKFSLWSQIDRDLQKYVESIFTKKEDTYVYKNITIHEFLSDKEYSVLTNQVGIHICPSMIEGYGHYINEARAKKAVILTTNSPPMNELIQDPSFLIHVEKKENAKKVMNIQYQYDTGIEVSFIDKKDLAKKIEKVLQVYPSNVGEENRKQFEKDIMYFYNTLTTFIQKIQKNTKNIQNTKPTNLYDFEKKVYSQNGEDGVLEKIFEVIGKTNSMYVEFGVEDGQERNTRYLQEKGWSGLLMDGGYENKQIQLQKEYITAENISMLFTKYKVPTTFDLLSIDIDYNDWYVLKEILQTYTPRVICMEYNASLGLEDKIVVYDPKYMWLYNRSNYFNASLYCIHRLCKKHNYTLVYCEKMGVNSFFVHNSCHPEVFMDYGNIEKIYREPKYGFRNTKGHPSDKHNRHYLTYKEASSYTYNHYQYSSIENICSYIPLDSIPMEYPIVETLWKNCKIRFQKEKIESPENIETFQVTYKDISLHMATHANDTVIYQKMQKGFLYEIYNTFIVESYATEKDIFLDIGANIGSMTIPISTFVKEVVSFEPFVKTFDVLSYNKKQNTRNNIILYNNAIGHTNRITRLSNSVVDINPEEKYKKSIKSIQNTKVKFNYGAIQLGLDGQYVQMITIDSLQLKKVDFIKVDTEGAENLVFYGAQKTITKHKPIIIFEKNWQTVTEDMKKSMNLSKEVVEFDIISFCNTLGYDTVIESDWEDFFLIPPGKIFIQKKLLGTLQKVKTIKGFSSYKNLYKYVKPKW